MGTIGLNLHFHAQIAKKVIWPVLGLARLILPEKSLRDALVHDDKFTFAPSHKIDSTTIGVWSHSCTVADMLSCQHNVVMASLPYQQLLTQHKLGSRKRLWEVKAAGVTWPHHPVSGLYKWSTSTIYPIHLKAWKWILYFVLLLFFFTNQCTGF